MELLKKKLSAAYPGCTVVAYTEEEIFSVGCDLVAQDVTVVARYGSINVWQHTFIEKFLSEEDENGMWCIDWSAPLYSDPDWDLIQADNLDEYNDLYLLYRR